MLNISLLRSALEDSLHQDSSYPFDVFRPLRQWLNKLDIRSPTQAHLICQLIPAQCPFERAIRIGNLIEINIPPLCKLNPLYEKVAGLRFRSLWYLAEGCSNHDCRYC